MDIGLCTAAAAQADVLADSTLAYVEDNVQSILAPRNLGRDRVAGQVDCRPTVRQGDPGSQLLPAE